MKIGRIAIGCSALALASAAQSQTVAAGKDQTGSALAQEAPGQAAGNAPESLSDQDIVVTATKREEGLSKVPIALSVFTAKKRDELGILTVQDLTNVTPGLVYNTAQDKVFIRGVGRQTNGVGTDPGVALYNDGFYAATTATAASSPLFTQRIEILRGPQGTLYGRNSVGGAINVISARPTKDWYAEIRGVVTNYNRTELRGSISGPITENLRFRVNGGWVKQRGGYFKNAVGGPDEGGVADDTYFEAQLEGTAGRLDYFLKYATTSQDDRWRFFTSAAPYNTTTFFTGPLGPNATFGSTATNPGVDDLRRFSANVPTTTRLHGNHLVVANLALHLDGVDVKYVGGFQSYVFDQIQDYDGSAVDTYQYRPVGSPVPLTISGDYRRRYVEDRSYYSHEVNVISTRPGPFQWIFGLYYLREDFKQPGTIYAPGQAELAAPLTLTGAPAAANPDRNYYSTFGEQKSDSYAVFGQVDYDLTSNLHLTAGLRWNRDEKHGYEATRSVLYNPSLGFGIGYTCTTFTNCFGIAYEVQNASRRLSDSWSALSGTAGVQWTPDARTLTYLKYSRGFKSGGFNLGSVAPVPEVDSEKIDAYEVGVKRTFGRALQLNIAAFEYRYHNLQLPLLVLPGNSQPARSDLVNLERSRARGVEIEASWAITNRLNLYLTYAWLDTKITQACCFVDPIDLAATLPGAQPVGLPNVNGSRAQNLAGNALPASPRNKISLAPSYRFDLFKGSLRLSGIYAWRDSVDAGLFANGLARAPSYDQVDLRATFTDASNRFSIVAFGRNVFDTLGYDGVGAQQTTAGVIRTYSLTPPRTYGLELQVRF
jgi:iron complex outermembrane receptor protein